MATGKELDAIYCNVDLLIRAGKLETLDDLLRTVPVQGADIDVLLGYLTATLPVSSKLSCRQEFYRKTQDELAARKETDPTILQGLQGNPYVA